MIKMKEVMWKEVINVVCRRFSSSEPKVKFLKRNLNDKNCDPWTNNELPNSDINTCT